MPYTVYKTTNIINNKIYIGVHKTDDPNDAYIGCGVKGNVYNKSKNLTPFQKAVRKYGYKNFKKEILFIFNNQKEAYSKEKELVTLDFIKSSENYNAMEGGKTPGKRVREFVVIDMENSIKYEPVSIIDFSFEHLKKPLSGGGLYHIIDKGKVLENRWWCCSKKNWKGYIELNDRVFVVIDLFNNKKYYINNISEFCRNNNLTYSDNNPKLLSKVSRGLYNVLEERWLVYRKGKEKTRIKNKKLKKVITPSLEVKYFYNISKFAEKNNLHNRSLHKLLKGEINHHKYFTTSIQMHHKYVSYIVKNNMIYRVKNKKEFAQIHGLCQVSLGYLINKKQNEYRGWKRFEGDFESLGSKRIS